MERVKGIEPSYSAWKSANFSNVFKCRSDILQSSGRLRSLRNFSLSECRLPHGCRSECSPQLPSADQAPSEERNFIRRFDDHRYFILRQRGLGLRHGRRCQGRIYWRDCLSLPKSAGPYTIAKPRKAAAHAPAARCRRASLCDGSITAQIRASTATTATA